MTQSDDDLTTTQSTTIPNYYDDLEEELLAELFETSTMGQPLPPADLPEMIEKEMSGSGVDYQQDPSWNPTQEQDHHEVFNIEYENKKVPFIRRKNGVLNLQESTITMVVEPQKYTDQTMVRSQFKI